MTSTAPNSAPSARQPLSRVYANHGRWLIQCECGAAVRARYPQGSWKCPLCGTLRKVLWPARERKRLIELILMVRPQPNRNWWPWESIANLLAENIEHGLPIPKGAAT